MRWVGGGWVAVRCPVAVLHPLCCVVWCCVVWWPHAQGLASTWVGGTRDGRPASGGAGPRRRFQRINGPSYPGTLSNLASSHPSPPSCLPLHSSPRAARCAWCASRSTSPSALRPLTACRRWVGGWAGGHGQAELAPGQGTECRSCEMSRAACTPAAGSIHPASCRRLTCPRTIAVPINPPCRSWAASRCATKARR